MIRAEDYMDNTCSDGGPDNIQGRNRDKYNPRTVRLIQNSKKTLRAAKMTNREGTPFISPFLLPYILADQEDRDKRARESVSRKSPGSTAMHSPLEDHAGRLSHGTFSPGMYRTAQGSPLREGTRFVSPNKRFSSDSPGAVRHSMIERSISELTFDPELTFMDSPAASSDLVNASPQRNELREEESALSLPEFSSPMKTVSPDRSVVPLDESEIGFSKQLRSLQTDTAASGKRGKSASARSTKSSAEVQGTSSKSKEDHSKQVEPNRIARQQRGPTKPQPEPEAIESSQPRILKRRAAAEEPKQEQLEPESINDRKKPRRKSPIEEMVASDTLRTKKPLVNATATASTETESLSNARKSPRFSSRVVTAVTQLPPLLVCPKCKKAYKRSRDFEKHVTACVHA
jgi:hypothetical protein